VRYLTSDLTPFPGKFSFERFPYFRKIVDCFSPMDSTQEVVLMKGNQMGATTAVLETIILYNIMSDPKAQMYVTADAGLVRTSVQVRVEKMIDNAGARDLIFSQSRKKKGSRNTGDTAVAKEYPGGYLHCLAGAARRGSAGFPTPAPWRTRWTPSRTLSRRKARSSIWCGTAPTLTPGTSGKSSGRPRRW
jgi:hypothetical protein